MEFPETRDVIVEEMKEGLVGIPPQVLIDGAGSSLLDGAGNAGHGARCVVGRPASRSVGLCVSCAEAVK